MVVAPALKLIRLLWLLLLVSAPAAAEPLHYRVAATFLPSIETAAVDVTIALGPVAAGEVRTFILGDWFTLQRVEAQGAAPAKVERTSKPWPGLQQISLRFQQTAERASVRMLYHGRINPTGELPINQIGSRLVELSLDGMWLPIAPGLDAPFTAEAMLSGLPQDAVVAAQGRVESRDGRVFIARDFPEIDLAFVASPDFQVEEGPTFTLYADPRSPLARFYVDQGTRARAWLGRWLGDLGDRGAERLKLAVVARPRRSGYARRGFIVTTDQGEPLNPPPAAKFIAHELAHLWFSNANATTAERWLDESTAEYAGIRYVEEVFGADHRDRMLAAKEQEAAKAPPLLGGGPDGAAIYAKGPLLLFALEKRIGRDRMDAVIGEVARNRVGRTPDFLAILARLTSPANAEWFERQLRQ